MGGFAALMGSIVLGPRIGRFDDLIDQRKFQLGHNPSLYILGTFLLWFSWCVNRGRCSLAPSSLHQGILYPSLHCAFRFSFNSVSLLMVDTFTAAHTVARTSTNTALAGAASGVLSTFLSFYRTRTWNMLDTCTGILGGGILSGGNGGWVRLLTGFMEMGSGGVLATHYLLSLL